MTITSLIYIFYSSQYVYIVNIALFQTTLDQKTESLREEGIFMIFTYDLIN